MKKYILATICMLLIYTASHAASLSDLIRDLRFITGELTDSTSYYTDSMANRWINLAQDRIVTLGGFIPKQVDIVFVHDSLTYNLPTDFRKVDKNRNIIIGDNFTDDLFFNPGMKIDTNVMQYFISWKNVDSALLYLKGQLSQDGATVRIFYLGTAANMPYDTSTCEVPEVLHGYILEEAMSYYIRSQKRFQEAFSIQAKLRQDMGVPVKE